MMIGFRITQAFIQTSKALYNDISNEESVACNKSIIVRRNYVNQDYLTFLLESGAI